MSMENKKFKNLPSNHPDKSIRKDAEVLRDEELDAVTGGGGEGDTQLPDLEGGHTTFKKV